MHMTLQYAYDDAMQQLTGDSGVLADMSRCATEGPMGVMPSTSALSAQNSARDSSSMPPMPHAATTPDEAMRSDGTNSPHALSSTMTRSFVSKAPDAYSSDEEFADLPQFKELLER